MKNKNYLLLAILLTFINLYCANIPFNQVKNVALNSFREINNSIETVKVEDYFVKTGISNDVLYIFNLKPQGYIIVAADNVSYPIIGYSSTTHYTEENEPSARQMLLNNFIEEIDKAILEGIDPNPEIITLWERLSVDYQIFSPLQQRDVLDPLLTTTWDQNTPYNTECPTFDGESCLVGCGAIAMGQIMKYFNFPNIGTGYNEYEWNNQTLYANFETVYNWDNMPNSLIEPPASSLEIDDTSLLLYHCGIALEMNYGLTGSGNSTFSVLPAFQNYFHYDEAATLEWKDDYGVWTWVEMLEDELNNGLPVFYRGSMGNSGHAFVVDGYSSYSSLFHINWGWGGEQDDFYHLSDLTPGNFNFNTHHAAVLGLKPTNYAYNVTQSTSHSTINDAIDAAFDYDTIIVSPGTYYENVEFEGKELILGSKYLTTGDELYKENTIIDGYNNGTVVSFGDSNYDDAMLIGFTLQNGFADSRQFTGRDGQFGGGIYCGGPYSTANISNNIIKNCNAEYGGGVCIGGLNILENNSISNNSSSAGGGIYCSGSDIIKYNLIVNNYSSFSGGGIECFNCSPQINHNTIVENNATHYGGGILCVFSSNPIVKNTILWDNFANCNSQIALLNDASIEVEYSNIQGGYSGIHNINTDPQFTSDYYLAQLSPCLDVGNPYAPLDPDGTFADMGFSYYHHDGYSHLFDDGIHWVSFPVLNEQFFDNDPNIGLNCYYEQAYTENSSAGIFEDYSTGNLSIDGFTRIDGKRINQDLMNIQYIDDDFENHNFDNMLFRHEGYQITIFDSNQETPFTTYGSLYDNAPLPSQLDMDTGEYHWLGYWLLESKNIVEAFGDFWEDVEKIKSQDWYYDRQSIIRGRGGAIKPSQETEGKVMEYGKTYMIWFKGDPFVTPPITGFKWDDNSQSSVPLMRSIPENFEFTEKTNYEAIDLLNIPAGVEEIGVFENGICLGAVVVQDSSEQVLVYSDAVNRDAGNFTFELFTGARFTEKIKKYKVLNFRSGEFEAMPLKAGRNEYSVIRFNSDYDDNSEETLLKTEVFNNYPNPFNPTTTISFNLATEQKIELDIYNSKGQKVKKVYFGIVEKGKHSIVWNGTDSNNKTVSSGVYFYKLKTQQETFNRKMLLMK